ncbi:ankyrin [Morchella conica CCBAS932]|uniref:protein S-acyltransferase n=1 Tax=Morchella conica CCBAS932 TaxID=1392247 RepID=A0A3N4KLS8_9PEZI|nr:ankyrin [Morchella conica CCBAS932]
MKIWAKDGDVASYIEQKISEYPRARSLSQGNYRDKIISELTECAKGMFLLVYFYIECLCQQTTTKQIIMELERIKKGSGGSTNRSLSPTYDRAMDILYAQHPPGRVELAIRVLSWLVKARKVLTIHQLHEAVTADEGCTTFEESDLPHMQTMIDACASRNPQWLDILTPHGTLMPSGDLTRVSPLQIGCILGHLSAVQKLLKNDSGVPTAENSEHEGVGLSKILSSWGCWACWKGGQSKNIAPIVRLVVENGANPSVMGPSQKMFLSGALYSHGTALHHAVEHTFIEAIEPLLSKGADISAADRGGWTALHLAAGHRSTKAMELLLSKGADISVADSDGLTALHYAAAEYGMAKETEFLLSEGADISAADSNGWTAFHLAARWDSSDSVKTLLDRGASTSDVDNKGKTALHLAARRGLSRF